MQLVKFTLKLYAKRVNVTNNSWREKRTPTWIYSMQRLRRHRPWHLFIKTIFHVKLNDCILDWESKFLTLGVKSWRAFVVWMWMPILLLALLGFVHTTGLAQGTKPTQTSTATVTETPTVTPTDSLNVFETPSTPTPDPQKIYISDPFDGSLVQGVINIKGKKVCS